MTLKRPESRQSGPGSQKGRRGLSFKTFALVGLAVLIALVSFVAWKISGDGLQTRLANTIVSNTLLSRLPPDADVSVGATRVSAVSGGAMRIELIDLAMTMPHRASAHFTSLAMETPIGSLLRGEIRPRALHLDGVGLGLAGVQLPPDDGSSRADKIRSAVAQFARVFALADRPIRDAGVSEVRISDVTISDMDTGAPLPDILQTVKAKEALWSILPDGRSKIWASLSSAGKAWNLILERDVGGAAGEQIELTVENFQPSSLFPRIADEAKRPYFDAPLTFVGRAFLGADGEVTRILARYRMDKGRLSIGFRDQINIDHVELLLALPAEADTLTIRNGTIRARQGGMSFAGQISLPPVSDPIGLNMRLGEAVLAAGPDRDPVILKEGGLFADFRPELSQLTIHQLSARSRAGSASIAGTLGGVGEAAGIALAVEFSEMPVALLRALWPPALSPAVRRWFDGNVFHASVGPGSIQVALPKSNLGPAARGKVMPDYALQGAIMFKDGEFRPAAAYPEIVDAAGSISFVNATAILSLDEGIVTLPDVEPANVSGTILAIPKLGAPGPVGNLELSVTGPADTVAALSNAGPLNVAEEQGIDPADLVGDIDARLSAEVPLGPDNPNIMPPPEFRIALSGFSSAKPIDGRLITSADLVLNGTPDAYRITGNADLDGIRADLNLMSSDAEDADVRLTLDDEGRRKLGLDFGSMVSGPILAAVTGQDENLPRSIVLDLTPATIRLPGLGWEKGAGVKGEARFIIEKTETGSLIRDLTIVGETFGAEGDVRLKDGSGLESISVRNASLRPGDAFEALIEKNGRVLAISVKGEAFDARGLIDAMKAPPSGTTDDRTPLSISFNMKRVTGYNQVTFSDASGTVRLNSKGLETVSVQGLFGVGGPAEAVLENNGSMNLAARSQNAGDVLRFLDIYERVNGGLLELNMDAGQSPGTEVGTLRLTNFSIVNEDALSEVVHVPDRSNDSNHADRVISRDAGVIGFSELGVPFRRSGGIIAIGEAFLRGPVIGGSATGTLNLDEKTLAISGTFIPAYGLNNLAGAIPFFGEILGGGRNGGLLGITFRIYGPIASPTLNLNPVSAIAPGIFRKIFEYR